MGLFNHQEIITCGCQLFIILLLTARGSFAKLCDITSGDSAVILDITESEGTSTAQKTVPPELPIEGAPDVDVRLTLAQERHQYFNLEGPHLVLHTPLDRDQKDISTIRFQILCTVLESGSVKNIPVIVRVSDINDNAPVFQGTPFTVTVREDSAVGATVFRDIKATDPDAGLNQQLEYTLIPGSGVIPAHQDGYDLFSIDLPHQGFITTKSRLDYETTDVYYLIIQATDHAVESPKKTSTTTLTIHVEDVDDQNPKFILDLCNEDQASDLCPRPGESPVYRTSVTSGRVEGVLSVRPDRIFAEDQDSLKSPVRYSFLSGTPLSYMQHFTLDSRTAVVSQIAAVDSSVTNVFNITIKAEEQSQRKGSSTAVLQVHVSDIDKSPPRLTASSYSGKVDEASSPGTAVTHDNDPTVPITLSVTDPDVDPSDPLPKYVWELTSSSFRVTAEGHLVVADGHLDRDPPSLGFHTFQVIARESGEGGTASAPVTLTVELNDINDNPPRFPVYPPITVTAGSGRRSLIKVEATDKDAGINGEVTYSLSEASRSLQDYFIIDRRSGQLDLVHAVAMGDQYQVAVTARDGGGLESTTVLDVQVARAPNTGGPTFPRPSYTVVVPEDSIPGHRVIKLKAKDPEGDVPRYHIVEGNSEGKFDIDSLSGVVSIIKSLDRETSRAYSLKIEAEDNDGQSSSVIVSVMVADVNDMSPTFTGLPYTFRVNEGLQGVPLGEIKAVDEDSGDAGTIAFSLLNNQPFKIDASSGMLKTARALDFEKQQVHYISIIATDKGTPPRETTATATVLVNDVNDESPKFEEPFYEATAKESAQPGTVVTFVKAIDPDTESQVTYVIKTGPTNLFAIDPESGIITTAAELDYEYSTNYTLVVGTVEGENGQQSSTTIVNIKLEDINDHSPVFQQVSPALVPPSVPLGTLITTVKATDDDGSSPNNQVTYELRGQEESLKYFTIDPSDGIIRTRGNLHNLTNTNIILNVVARDNGDPPLVSSEDVRITILPSNTDTGEAHGTAGPPVVVIPASFVTHDVVVSVPEDATEGHVVTKLQVDNKPKDYFTNLRCSVLEAHLHKIFEALINDEGDCEVKIGPMKLDYETQHHYNITVALHSLATPLPTPDTKTKISITILDVNDNAPVFKITEDNLKTGTYSHPIIYTLISRDAKVSSNVIHVVAEDADSGPGGVIKYSLVPGSNRGGYFTVESHTGVIKTLRPLTAVPNQLLPFNLTLLAMDNPSHPSVHHTTSANIIVNVVDSSSQLVLAIKAPLNEVKSKKQHITSVLGEHANHMIIIEKLEHHKYVTDNTIEIDPDATDVWFNMIDQSTGKLLPREHHAVLPLLLQGPDQSHLLLKMTESLKGTQVLKIRHPDLKPPANKEIDRKNKSESIKSASSMEGSQLALFTLGAAIILLGTTAIAVLCISWLKYTKKRNAAEKTMMVIAPSIDHCESVNDSTTKEYEVQVLHMSVPMDDESVHEVYPSQPRHHISLDNVSYISKQNMSREVSSSDGDSPGSNSPHIIGNNGWTTSKSFASAASASGRNPAYERFSDHIHDDDDGGPLSISTTNENVMFGRRHHTDHSPVEDTTEL